MAPLNADSHHHHPAAAAGGAAAWLIGLLLYALSGRYKGLTRYVGSCALYWLALRGALLSLQNKPRQTLTRVAIYGA